MSEILRVCPACGESGPLDARHCAACGQDTQGDLPVQQRNLPATIGRAALPIVAGAASLALRAGWKLLQNRLAAAQEAAQNTQAVTAPRPTTPQPSSPQPPAAQSSASPRRTIRIRSTWVVGDDKGNTRHGASDHMIDFD